MDWCDDHDTHIVTGDRGDPMVQCRNCLAWRPKPRPRP